LSKLLFPKPFPGVPVPKTSHNKTKSQTPSLFPPGTGTPLSSQLIRVPVPKTPHNKTKSKSTSLFPGVPVPRTTNQKTKNPNPQTIFPRVPVPNLSSQLIRVPVPKSTPTKKNLIL